MPYAVILVHDHPQRETFAQQFAFFKQAILPTATSLPGFLRGNWAYDPAPSRTHSYVVFDTEAHANKLLEDVRRGAQVPNPFGVTLVSAAIAEELLTQ